ncbi:hypothetical protein ACGVWS_01350 [Enterobacteriaceae bacterium LUAb1]
MIACGDVVCLNDVAVIPADLFYIDHNGALICRNGHTFRFSGAKSIIAAFNPAVSQRDSRYSDGKPAPTSARKLRPASRLPDPEQVDLNDCTHECREYQCDCNLGWETGRPDGNIEAYDLWNNTHTATPEDDKLTGTAEDLYPRMRHQGNK